MDALEEAKKDAEGKKPRKIFEEDVDGMHIIRNQSEKATHMFSEFFEDSNPKMMKDPTYAAENIPWNPAYKKK